MSTDLTLELGDSSILIGGEVSMPSVSGTVYHGDGSTASGRSVSGLAAGMLGGMVGPTTTDSRGRFVLSWNSSTTTLAKLYVDGKEMRTDVRAGDDVPIRL